MPALPTRARKTSHNGSQQIMSAIPTRSQKRMRADAQAAETSSETSRTSANDAIFSDNDSTSQATNQTEADSDSDLSTSSEEPSSESDYDSDDNSDDESDTTDRGPLQNDEEITNLRPGTKPNMRLGALKRGLLQRLKTFIPELAAANQELDKERLDGTIKRRNIEQVEEGDGPFIELDLGLGVFEEKSTDITTSQQDLHSDSDSEQRDDETDSKTEGPDVFSRLMGQGKKVHKDVQIEELGD